MGKITCEGFGIAHSEHDEECEGCRVEEKCASQTLEKLNNAKSKRGGTTMAKKLTKKQLEALLKKAKTAKSIKAIVKDNKIKVKLVKGMTIDDAKEAVMNAAFPPEDDDFDDDDFGDEETAEETGDDPDEDVDDFDDDDGADLDDPDSDDDGGSDDADDSDSDDGGSEEEVDDSPDDPVEIDALIARIEALEKRLDEAEKAMTKAAPASAGSKKAAKEAKKAELLAGVPYTKESIEKLNSRELKMLASAMGINSFRVANDKLIPQILKNKANKKK